MFFFFLSKHAEIPELALLNEQNTARRVGRIQYFCRLLAAVFQTASKNLFINA